MIKNFINNHSKLIGTKRINNHWKSGHQCYSCTCKLSEDEVMYSNGRCPNCGVKSPSSVTIVKTTEYGVKTDVIINFYLLFNIIPFIKLTKIKTYRDYEVLGSEKVKN